MSTEQWLTSSNYRKRFQCSSHLCKFTELISSLGWGSFLWCPFDRSWLARSDVVWTLDRDSLCWYTGYPWHAFLTRRLSFLPLSESPESCYSLCFPISASFEDTRCEHLCFGERALWRWRIPEANWEWWRCTERQVQHPSRLKYQTPRSYPVEETERHMLLNLAFNKMKESVNM